MQNFGEWLRDARTSRRKTQTECAAIIGMKVQQWNQLEKLVRRPEKETLLRISEALGMNDSEVMEAAGYYVADSDLPAEWVTIWKQIPRNRQANFLRAVRSMADAVSV